MSNQVKAVFSGDFACFTRPDLKAERVSYEVMTPSAARGALEAIFWKPEMAFHVRKITVLKPIKTMSITRNEIKTKQSLTPFNIADVRTQRHSLILKDVSYLVEADITVPPNSPHHHRKYVESFNRRLRRGACAHQPYLGCREFSADFWEPTGEEVPLDLTKDLGKMFWGFDWTDPEKPLPLYFVAQLVQGTMHVPAL